jgi:hypothetical protein
MRLGLWLRKSCALKYQVLMRKTTSILNELFIKIFGQGRFPFNPARGAAPSSADRSAESSSADRAADPRLTLRSVIGRRNLIWF